METEQARGNDTFFAVSTRKMVVMSLCSFGLYQVYWLYWNWRIIKFRDHRKISPPWRSVLGLFFLYPILRRINRGSARLGMAGFSASASFIGWLVLSLLAHSRHPALTLLSYASVFALVPAQRSANAINFATSTGSPANDRLDKFDWIVVAIGGPLFVLTVLGTLLQHV